MFEFLQSSTSIQFFGIAGCLATALGSLISGLAYRGKQGQRYSPFNHFISELGEIGVSHLAWVFNLGLILSGLLLLPCCIGLGLRIPGIWSKLGMICGCLAAVALSLVGIFPMNNIKPHGRSAVAYFRLGLLMILLFTVAIAVQRENPPTLPRLIGLVGAPAIFSYAFFLIYSPIAFRTTENALETTMENRPRFWLLTISEWLIFATTIPWFCAVAAGL